MHWKNKNKNKRGWEKQWKTLRCEKMKFTMPNLDGNI